MENKVVIITGGAMGLGYAAADVLASQKAKLVLVDYNADALAEAEEKLKKTYEGLEVLSVTADVSKEDQVKA